MQTLCTLQSPPVMVYQCHHSMDMDVIVPLLEGRAWTRALGMCKDRANVLRWLDPVVSHSVNNGGN
jgi:hypothetical protein